MTGEEKRRQLKEQYKRDLKLRKEFLEKAKTLRHQNKINKALGDMLEGMSDDSQDWIDQINQETALTEAKFEIFIEQAADAEKKAEQIAREAEMSRINAESLVEKMKQEMGLLPEKEEGNAKEEARELTMIEVESEDENNTEANPSKPETEEDQLIEMREDESQEEEPPTSPSPRQQKSMGDF